MSWPTTAESAGPNSGTAIEDDVGVLEPADGETSLIPDAADARVAAFSPDEALLATGQRSWGCQQPTGGLDEDRWLRGLERTDATFLEPPPAVHRCHRH